MYAGSPMPMNDPFLMRIVIGVVVVLLTGLILRLIRQPLVIGYIIAGILLGPSVSMVLQDTEHIAMLGNLGVIFLLFFLGTEFSPQQLLRQWRVAIWGTTLQIVLSVLVVMLLGWILHWPLGRSLLLGFVISLSSTAVLLKFLEEKGELHTAEGQRIVSILLVQDLAIIPMMILLSIFGGNNLRGGSLAGQIIGGIVIILTVAWLVHRKSWKFPFRERIINDHELQVFGALAACFFLAGIMWLLDFSPALGAFLAGIVVASGKDTSWLHQSLYPFKVLFVALFFVSVGLLLNLAFLWEHLQEIILLVFAVFLTNTFLNALIFRWLGESWKSSLYSGALLSQIGEFSFVLSSAGVAAGLISAFGHQITLSVITLSLLLSPFWIGLMRKMVAKF